MASKKKRSVRFHTTTRVRHTVQMEVMSDSRLHPLILDTTRFTYNFFPSFVFDDLKEETGLSGCLLIDTYGSSRDFTSRSLSYSTRGFNTSYSTRDSEVPTRTARRANAWRRHNAPDLIPAITTHYVHPTHVSLTLTRHPIIMTHNTVKTNSRTGFISLLS